MNTHIYAKRLCHSCYSYLRCGFKVVGLCDSVALAANFGKTGAEYKVTHAENSYLKTM